MAEKSVAPATDNLGVKAISSARLEYVYKFPESSKINTIEALG